jgi:hypothetical protein
MSSCFDRCLRVRLYGQAGSRAETRIFKGWASSDECVDLVNKRKTHELTREDDAHCIAVGEKMRSQEIKINQSCETIVLLWI